MITLEHDDGRRVEQHIRVHAGSRLSIGSDMTIHREDSGVAGNDGTDGLKKTLKPMHMIVGNQFWIDEVVQKAEKPAEDEGVRVRPVRKPGNTSMMPRIQPESDTMPSHYVVAAGKQGPTIRAPVREAASSAPQHHQPPSPA